jgi:hypothetical protein
MIIALITWIVGFSLLALLVDFIVVLAGGTAAVGLLVAQLGIAGQIAAAVLFGGCAGWAVAAWEDRHTWR